MILAVDVDYRPDGGAVAAGVLFAAWDAAEAERTIVRHIAQVQPYWPGQFFERELPCLLAVLGAGPTPEAVVVDGHAWLGVERRPGLGAHLHAATGLAVIGVAKTPFRDTPAEVELRRGGSARPLYVTAAGMDEAAARAHVAAMHGEHRVPTLLRAVDWACRTG